MEVLDAFAHMEFQCSPLSRRSCNIAIEIRSNRMSDVSVLTPEPKVVQLLITSVAPVARYTVSVLTPEPKVVQPVSARAVRACTQSFSAHP